MTLATTPDERLQRALLSLEGLSVGDAFGQQFFGMAGVSLLTKSPSLSPPPWSYTDDTEMALGIVGVLREHQTIDQDALAATFARRYRRDPHRGYGAGAHDILTEIGAGGDWREVSSAAFNGSGSLGNGGAMRVAPVGAYFADDDERVIAEARRSAEVTHAHPEGQAGAIAVALAAAWAARHAAQVHDPDLPSVRAEMAADLFRSVLAGTPPGRTRDGIARARDFDLGHSAIAAAKLLGSGAQISAPDTVPFTIWCAARHFDDYQAALWSTVSGLGDRDTTCAIVGGIVALSAGAASISAPWSAAREALQME